MRERTHENRGSSQEIESNQVFHWWPVLLSWSGERAKEFALFGQRAKEFYSALVASLSVLERMS